MTLRPDEDVDISKALARFSKVCVSDLSLSSGLDVSNYLKKRGLSEATISTFNIGSMPIRPEFISKYMGPEAAFQSGIISRGQDGYLTSKFTSHKLLIPIYDEFGKNIAVMGRCLVSEKKREKLGIPKYINTNFKKGDSLFGLSVNKESIRSKNLAYVVEGNFDVITAYQNNMKNVVATCGTALTRQQLVMLARYTDNIKVLFDNDSAGQESSTRILAKYKDCGLSISKSFLPAGIKDLDEYFTSKKSATDL